MYKYSLKDIYTSYISQKISGYEKIYKLIYLCEIYFRRLDEEHVDYTRMLIKINNFINSINQNYNKKIDVNIISEIIKVLENYNVFYIFIYRMS